MGHREFQTSDSHLEEWASLLGSEIADDRSDCSDREYDLFDEQDDSA